MTELNQPIVTPTDLQGQRRLQQAFRAQFNLEEFARLVRDMRRLQGERGFGRLSYGPTKDLESLVDTRVQEILDL